jgi:hypothetical protein
MPLPVRCGRQPGKPCRGGGLVHLPDAQDQPAWQTPSWRYTIRDQRLAIADLLTYSPSLRNEGATVLTAAYQRTRLCAANEIQLPEATFPDVCP